MKLKFGMRGIRFKDVECVKDLAVKSSSNLNSLTNVLLMHQKKERLTKCKSLSTETSHWGIKR